MNKKDKKTFIVVIGILIIFLVIMGLLVINRFSEAKRDSYTEGYKVCERNLTAKWGNLTAKEIAFQDEKYKCDRAINESIICNQNLTNASLELSKCQTKLENPIIFEVLSWQP